MFKNESLQNYYSRTWFQANKKELVIGKNKLFSDIKMLNFNDGKPKDEEIRKFINELFHD